MSPEFEKLKACLKELFQLNRPELDFGLYRIMHAKSAEVTEFLEKDLLPQVRDAFDEYRSADRAELEKELERATEQAEGLGVDPESTAKVKKLRARLRDEAVDIGALEAGVYDHLYRFFRRYYSDGDFLSKRVYKPGVYAIPYEGEEVKLHWANADQYYTKTSEYLRDYAFRLRPGGTDPMRVHFRLVDAAEGEHGNVKEANNRVFVLAPAGEGGHDFVTERKGEQGAELVLRFEYRPATMEDWPPDRREEEEERLKNPKPPGQKDLNALAAGRVLAVTEPSLAPWIGELGKPHVTANGEEADYSRLEAHLRRYTARNQFDYFIHKDLGGFLRRELDFYIKNEVMHLDDIESESVPRVEQYLSKIKVIRMIAGKIIDFLAQLEDFQKKLWLKRKFVVETSWCIRVGCIPEGFYHEIAANEAQRSEWVALHAIDEFRSAQSDLTRPEYTEPLSEEFLRAHPTLMVDSRNFPDDFTARLLDAFEDLDAQTDGVLFHSENFQALSLMASKVETAVQAAYCDPPYNTSEETFVYKNLYRHSSWLSMMRDRLRIVRRLLASEGSAMVAIDDAELSRLHLLLEEEFGASNLVGTLVVQSNPRGRGINSFYATSHDYYLVAALDASQVQIVDQPLTEDQAAEYSRKDEESDFRLLPFRRSGGLSTPVDRPNSEFSLYYSRREKRIVAVGGKRKNEYPAPYTPEEVLCLDGGELRTMPPHDFLATSGDDVVEILPIDSEGRRRVWRWSDRGKILRSASEGEFVVRVEGGQASVQLKDRIKSGRKPKTVWVDPKYDASSHGTNLLRDVIGDRGLFGYPKSLHSTLDALHSIVGANAAALTLDPFAGSGTTGHAVINLNREDGGDRTFILVEMGEYFDTVLLPRLKKVTYSPEWKDGKPKRLATSEEADRSPRLMKVVRLESYEDALNNLEPRRTEDQQDLLDAPEAQGPEGFREDYLLRYMLDVETRGNASLLDLSSFSDPTAYRLKVKRPGSDEARETPVDLVETFNWLIGLRVEHLSAPEVVAVAFDRDSEGRLRLDGDLENDPDGTHWFRAVHGTAPDGRRVLVIWRKVSGDLEEENLLLDEWFRRRYPDGHDFDLIYVNGSNNLESLRGADGTWTVRLIEEDFRRLMFAGGAD